MSCSRTASRSATISPTTALWWSTRSAGGLVTALEPVVEAAGGVWVLELHPEFRERFTFVQIAEPSRDCLPACRDIRSRIVETAGRVNGRFASDRYRPIILLEARHEPADVYRFLRAADVRYAGSLHDGMNLVAKEVVSARTDNRGVLVLSESAGAARELTSALIVNPHETDRCAQALARALEMPVKGQATRMRVMRSTVARHNACWWAGQMPMDGTRLRRVDARARGFVGSRKYAGSIREVTAGIDDRHDVDGQSSTT